jgi:hypothetical protein
VRVARALAVWLMASLMTLTILSCSAPAEQPLLSRFFAASRLRDLTALQTIATVVFEPNVDGVVTSFDVMHVVSVVEPNRVRESKEVSISAPVRLPDGRMQQKDFVITITRARSDGRENHWGGWMIVAIRGRADSPSTRRL